jgi:hypothetical protein
MEGTVSYSKGKYVDLKARFGEMQKRKMSPVRIRSQCSAVEVRLHDDIEKVNVSL